MSKNELKSISERYGMMILRDPITSEAWGLALETAKDIPELDAQIDSNDSRVVVTKEYCAYCEVSGTHLYKVVCPVEWFDLWGWSGD